MIEIDGTRAIEAVREAVAEHGGALRRGCRYEENGGPCCVVGASLFKVGVPIETLALMDVSADGSSSSIYSWESRSVLTNAGFEMTRDAEDIFSAAQTEADSELTWSEALQEAEREARDQGIS